MKLYELLKTKLNEDFVAALLAGRSRFAFRPGYFYIRSYTYKKIGVFGEIAMGQVNWKSDPNAPFIEDVIFEVALSSLHSINPDEISNLFYDALVGKVIYAHQPFLTTKKFDGVEKGILRCNWQFVDVEPKFINEQNAGIYAFAGSATTLLEAHKNFLSTTDFDFNLSEEAEAEWGYLGDALIGDTGENELDLIGAFDDDTIVEDLPDDEDENSEQSPANTEI